MSADPGLSVSDAELWEISRQARLELARRYASRGDVLNWGKTLFPWKFPLPFCPGLHQYFVDVRSEEHTATEAPRNHAKSTIRCFLIPLFQALVEPHTYSHYLNVQATVQKGMVINNSIKNELETNADLIELYGDQTGPKWNEQQFVLKNGTIFTAIGAGQSIRGLNFNNIRPDYTIVDDLYDEEDINNPESTAKKNDWFWGSLYPARAKSRRCSLHVQGTAINAEDLLEQLKTRTRWKCRTFKAVIDFSSRTVLWPELNTFDSLMADKDDMGSVIFYRELQNERRDSETSIIKPSWLDGWEYDPDQLRFDNHFFINRVILTCDPSIGQKVENDYTGGALMLECKYDDGDALHYYIEGLWNEHFSLDKRVQLLQRIVESQPADRPVRAVYIEGIAGFKDFVAEVRRRTSLPVHEVDVVKDKITNLENKSHYFENRKVRLNKNIERPLKDVIKYQLTTNHPKHDDVRDAVLLGLKDRKRGPTVTVF